MKIIYRHNKRYLVMPISNTITDVSINRTTGLFFKDTCVLLCSSGSTKLVGYNLPTEYLYGQPRIVEQTTTGRDEWDAVCLTEFPNNKNCHFCRIQIA